MTNAKIIAMPAEPIDRNDCRAFGAIFVALLASIVLAGCSGGADTTNLPPPGGGGSTNDTPYTGPVARDADVLKFQQEFWSKTKTTDRCGSCHNETIGQVPMFVRNDDVNLAYDAALPNVDILQPANSLVVERVSNNHNCWVPDDDVCATIMTTWIENWVGDAVGGGRQIVLVPPNSDYPGDSLNFPADPTTPGTNGESFATTVYPLLTQYCSNCHVSESVNQQQPYFADPDILLAYEAAKSKMNLDIPANSRFVIRLRIDNHQCWDDCALNSQAMEDAITLFSGGILETQVDPDLLTSHALRLVDGTLASGGNRYEDAQVALWEFKTGSDLVAYDTSGVDPAVNLNLSQEVTWFGGWGITTNGGRAQGTTTASKKLFDVLQASGEFSIEAWVIPANVSQEEARIISYSANATNRNFALQQTLYNYDFLLRTNAADQNGAPLVDLNGSPALSTPDMDEVLQATLQHVVATYHPIDGRRIYVNGALVSNADPIPGGTFIDWLDTFALVLGSEIGGGNSFEGTFRLAAIHRRALTQQQVQQNFDVGVGEKFFLLFDISDHIQAAAQSSYILFEVAQYDSYSYLFDKPHFITLDGSTPEGIPIEGVRVAMNGFEAPAGQTYATLVDALSASEFVELGQPLSILGAVLPLEKGPQDDEFFLTFDVLMNPSAFNRQPDPALVIIETDVPLDERSSDIGVKTFDEIDATFGAVTGINRTDYPNSVDATYLELRQSLPAVEDINTFLSSHQVAIAQLAIEYCNALVNADGDPGSGQLFVGFDFDDLPAISFSVANRGTFVNPLINNIMGTGLASQPAFSDVYAELASFQAAGNRPDNLIDRLLAGGSDTRAISKGVCAAMIGNAVTLIQ